MQDTPLTKQTRSANAKLNQKKINERQEAFPISPNPHTSSTEPPGPLFPPPLSSLLFSPTNLVANNNPVLQIDVPPKAHRVPISLQHTNLLLCSCIPKYLAIAPATDNVSTVSEQRIAEPGEVSANADALAIARDVGLDRGVGLVESEEDADCRGLAYC